MSEPLRVGLIGYGTAGEFFHAPLIATTPGMVLDTVVTGNEERRRRILAAHPGARVVPEAERLWDSDGPVDLVVVAAPNRAHVPLARAALEAGRPVVVDKPIAPTAAEAAELDALARERGLLLNVFQNRRWDGDFRTLRDLAGSGELGEVRRFESRFERWRPAPKPGWREQGDPAQAGGVLYDLGSHLVDQALVLLGPAAAVYAERDHRRPGVKTDDDVFIALHHENGARSHLWASAVAGQLGPRFRVLGSESAYVKHRMDPQEAELRAGGRPGGPGWGAEPRDRWGLLGAGDDVKPVETLPGDYPAFYRGVARALREGGPGPVPAADAVRVMEVLDAARESAAAGTVVTLAGGAG
ncbi:Gfo/Idh/MocA family oxidoreductase [Bailinhaonella thermotolerans]|uniref:Oxidoreductase n=1 Tax=Bailinhaonella thermotolerans TaxID=1070861 RepID=A0A3A4AYB2_9ACTN|nr:Gfo/Idh/MocA family oxidoreductase [Bailinhaonella thermotolerans]RJL34103.1 oxidoreductase [Bailinhaonella thermotolerans]